MDYKTIPLYALSVIQLIICVGLLSIARSNRRAKWLAISILPSLFWAFFIGLFLSTENQYLSAFFVPAYYISAAILPPCYMFMAFAFTNRRISKSMIIGLSLVAAIVCLMVTVPGQFVKDIDIATHIATLSTVPYIIYTTYFMSFYLVSMGLILLAYLASLKNKRKRGSGFGLFLVGWLVLGVVGTIFNLFLPLFGNYELIWIGPLGLFMLVPMAFRIATTGEHFSAVKTFVRGLLYCLYVAVMAACVYAVIFFMDQVLEFVNITVFERYSIGTLISMLLLAAAFLLYRLTGNIVRRLNSDGYDEAEVLRSMSQIASEKRGVVDFFRSVRHTLNKAFGVEFVDIVVFGQKTAVHVGGNGGLEGALHRLATDRNKYGTVYREDVRDKATRDMLVAHNIEVVTPVIGIIDKKTAGVIVLSPRKRRFDRYYGETLVKVSAVLSPFIQSAVFYEEISNFNTRLKQQVREKTRELRESNKELMKLDELKDDLLSIASHNLRTPLTGIIGYADMLREGDFGKMKPEQAAILGEMVKSGRHMTQILSDFLDVTRISSGRLVLKKETINLTDLVIEEVASLKEMAAQYGRELTLKYDEKKIKITGDELHIRQAIVNLVDNAIYYGKTKVEVNLTKDGTRAIFTVKDDGMGVPKEDQPKLFTKMFRASNARAARPDGSGIGLYVIKNIVEDGGGRIIFESVEGEGSTFGFEI